MSRPIPEKIGRYTILCELGVGGMATVYLGRSRGLGDFERLFAIKMIHANLCEVPEFVSLFLNEARIAARIHHPHVVPVYDIDIEDERYYLSMDYVSGETLQLALKATWNEGLAFPIDVAAHAVASVCEGLHAAHELQDPDGDPLGVVHRDVAPQNIILGYDGIVRIMDFGIAKALDQVSLTQPGTWRGSVPYLAPEQVQPSSEIDRRTDVFALGVVLWETTVGQRLFQHHTELGTVARILGMEIPRPSKLREGYPQELEKIVMRSLERDPEKRFQTAQEMGDALRRSLVSSGICTTSTTIQRFLGEAFGERRGQRRAMERNASSVQVTGRIESLPVVPVPSDLLRPVKTMVEPIDDPKMVRLVTEINAVPTGAVSVSPVPGDFGEQPETEVSEVPKVRPPSRKTSRPLRATSAMREKPRRTPMLALLALPLLLAAGLAFWLLSSSDEPTAVKEEELTELESGEPVEDGEESLVAGSVSITDMAGDGGKKGTVAFYFRVIPTSAKVHVNGEPLESDLVVPKSRTRYTIRFSNPGHHPQVVTVSAEASRLIEAKLKPASKNRKRKRIRRRRRRAAR